MAALESSPCTPAKAATATIHRNPSDGTPLKHVQPKLPAGDSPYVRAKHVQLVEKDPNKAIPLFWAAINSGDRVDSALKDMAVVMKQVNRAEEAIEAIKSFRYLCSIQAQEPLDNVLLDLYKKCGKIDDQIEMLNFKLKMIDDGLAFGGRTTKLARSQGKKFHVSLVQEKSRLLGNLAWAYMQSDNYMAAESLYWQALAIEPDHNKQCNLAICLMKTGRLVEAKSLLQNIKEPSREAQITNSSTESYLRSFERASEMLMTLESQSGLQLEGHNISATASNPVNSRRSEDFNGKNLLNEFSSPLSVGKWKRESVSQRVPSPPSCGWKSPKYVTPSFNKWPGQVEASADICQQRSKSSCNKALFSPASVDGSPNSKTLADEEHSGTSIKNHATAFEKPLTIVETKKYPIEDNSPKPELTREPQTHSGISQAKGLKGLANDALSAIAGADMIPRSVNLVMGSRRQADAVKVEAVSQRRRKEQSHSSDNISVTGRKNLNPPAQDCLFANGERRTKANHVMDTLVPKPLVQSLTANGNISANAPSKESGSSMKASENKNQGQKSQNCEKGSPRCNDIGEEEVFSGIMKMGHPQNLDLDNNLTSITESMKPPEDPSIFTSGRMHFREPAVQSCSADVHVLKSKISIQSPNQVSFGSLSTSMNVNQIQGSDVSTDIGGQIEILGEKFPQGVSNNGNSQNSDNASACMDKIPEFRGDKPVSYGGNRTWAEMVEEEEENLANENLRIDIVADHATGSCKNSSEEHVKTPPALNSKKTWADMVEEEECLVSGNLNHSAAIDSHDGSRKHASTEQPAHEGFPDENVNFINIVRSTPCQKHQMPQNYAARFCQKISMLDIQEGSESGSKTPRKNSSARRSLSFDEQPMWDLSKGCFLEAGLRDSLHMVAKGSWSNCEMNLKRAKQCNRLRVFQEITLDEDGRD
uniref:Uncharacterized protein LOC105049157 n=2 Tax=Elaeis guineensis var. tenera TaxID=51953 RepID=A0A6I9RIF3_ELAGV|nr:uncharacterized protein LOC105049157 [Elaeis guineensis]